MKLQDMSIQELKELAREARELAKRKEEEEMAKVKAELDKLTSALSGLKPQIKKVLSVLGKKDLRMVSDGDIIKIRFGDRKEKDNEV